MVNICIYILQETQSLRIHVQTCTLFAYVLFFFGKCNPPNKNNLDNPNSWFLTFCFRKEERKKNGQISLLDRSSLSLSHSVFLAR
jgi:hypothetical protein